MKKIFLILVLFTITSKAQTENIIIITTDGFRWQEAKGMDETLARDKKFNKRTAPTFIKSIGLSMSVNAEKN
jgi:hypothetical protein